MNYAQQYLLASALKQETGAIDLSGWTSSWRPWAFVGGIAGVGALVGGLMGGGKGAAIGATVVGIGGIAVLASGTLMPKN